MWEKSLDAALTKEALLQALSIPVIDEQVKGWDYTKEEIVKICQEKMSQVGKSVWDADVQLAFQTVLGHIPPYPDPIMGSRSRDFS